MCFGWQWCSRPSLCHTMTNSPLPLFILTRAGCHWSSSSQKTSTASPAKKPAGASAFFTIFIVSEVHVCSVSSSCHVTMKVPSLWSRCTVAAYHSPSSSDKAWTTSPAWKEAGGLACFGSARAASAAASSALAAAAGAASSASAVAAGAASLAERKSCNRARRSAFFPLMGRPSSRSRSLSARTFKLCRPSGLAKSGPAREKCRPLRDNPGDDDDLVVTRPRS
mmetsp:Transcript_59478/g.159302  ORF Transcript_59478/g.159302 Transcript_59478/m.159302 type:complete len:223 (+) Transcript_59478:750-1418(+)